MKTRALGMGLLLLVLLGTRCPLSGLEAPCVTPQLPVASTTETFLMGGDPLCATANTVGNLCGANSKSPLEGDGDRTVPEHLVTLSPFVMDQTEVSNLQYRDCVNRGVCNPPRDCVPFAPFVGVLSAVSPAVACRYELREFDDLPVVAVTWEDARAYCEFRGSTLPTEAQWERAAVGPRRQGEVARKFPWGDETNVTERAGVVTEDRCEGALKDRPLAVRPNPRVDGQSAEGIYDLTGNVREWTLDDFDPAFYCRDTAHLGPQRAIRANDCSHQGSSEDGGVAQDCVRSNNAPVPPDVVTDPHVEGTHPRKVVRGGAFCSTNASQIQHDCDLHTRSRMGLDQDFLSGDVPQVPLVDARLAGFLSDAQLTGFRCVRGGTVPVQENTCETLERRSRPYPPTSSSSSGGAGGSSASSGMGSSGS